MRSRYSAYALGDYGEYLLKTWLPAMARGLTVEALSQRDNDWLDLEVIAKSQRGDDGYVEFKAYFANASSSETQVLHEKSVFKRVVGKWLYVGGEIS